MKHEPPLSPQAPHFASKRPRTLAPLARAVLACMLLALAAPAGAQSLAIPKTDGFGKPTDVGLLIIGHSTSAQGDYPRKLEDALNQTQSDGRHYTTFRAITGGDGGFLWSQARFTPSDPQYNRVLASTSSGQYCTDTAGNRWSCRRLKLDRALIDPDLMPGLCSSCTVESTMTCTYSENGTTITENLGFNECWQKMDYRLALIQDTSNRSWPIDDYNSDGMVNVLDYWPASKIPASARPCTSGTLNPSGIVMQGGVEYIDWNCDGTLTNQDASHVTYAGWLQKLSNALLNSYAFPVHHVFITPKPLEMGGCPYFPGEACSNHGLRTPTASRPIDHFYNPAVYWEYRVAETMFSNPNLDSRIHPLVPGDPKKMWDRSVKCYDVSLASSDWTIPGGTVSQGVLRPTNVIADDAEDDADVTSMDANGCMRSDHIHHTTTGGWMMADVWYGGLLPYLQ